MAKGELWINDISNAIEIWRYVGRKRLRLLSFTAADILAPPAEMWATTTLDSDFSTSEVDPQVIPALQFTPESGKTYAIEIQLNINREAVAASAGLPADVVNSALSVRP